MQLTARHNYYKLGQRFLSIIGDLVIYHNRTLKRLDLLGSRMTEHVDQDEEEDNKEIMFIPPKPDDKQTAEPPKLADPFVQKDREEVVRDWQKWLQQKSCVDYVLI